MENTCCIDCINKYGGCCTEVRFSIHENDAKPFLEKFQNRSLVNGQALKKDGKNSLPSHLLSNFPDTSAMPAISARLTLIPNALPEPKS